MSATDGSALRLSLARDPAELSRLARSVQAFLDARPELAAAGYALQLALEELVSNVIRHADDEGVTLTIDVTLHAEPGAVAVRVEDDGPAFDPLGYPAPDVDAPLEERSVGGLGIHLVRNVATDLCYTRDAGRNRLTLRVPVEG